MLHPLGAELHAEQRLDPGHPHGDARPGDRLGVAVDRVGRDGGDLRCRAIKPAMISSTSAFVRPFFSALAT